MKHVRQKYVCKRVNVQSKPCASRLQCDQQRSMKMASIIENARVAGGIYGELATIFILTTRQNTVMTAARN